MSTLSSIDNTGLARVQFFDITGAGSSRTFPSYSTLRTYVDNGYDVRLRYTEGAHVMYFFMHYKTSDRLIFSHVILGYTTEYVNTIDVLVAHNDDTWDLYTSNITIDSHEHWPVEQNEPDPGLNADDAEPVEFG